MQQDSFGFVVLAFALAVGGGVLGATLGTSHKRLCALISFGAGSLLGVTAFAIVPEAWKDLHVWQLLLALASGYVLFSLISKYLFHVCPACAASHFDEATTHRFSEIASAMMLALAIHCTVDGLAISAGGEESQKVNLAIIVAICVHKIPEGLALGALLLGAGLTRKSIISWVASVEATTLLGGAIGLIFLPNMSPFWVAIALAHAGGGFLFLASHAVIGEILKHHKALVLTNFAAGFALIGCLVAVLPSV